MLFSVEDFKTRFAITGTGLDAQIAVLRRTVSSAVQSYCHRVLEYDGTETTEFHDGLDLPYLLVRRPPVISVTALYVDAGRTFDASTLVPTTGYMVIDEGNRQHSGMIELTSGWSGMAGMATEVASFGAGRQSIKVVYRGGFDEIPLDLKEGAMLWAYHMSGKKPGVTSETIGAYSASYEQGVRTVPREVSAMLSPYIRVTTGRRL